MTVPSTDTTPARRRLDPIRRNGAWLGPATVAPFALFPVLGLVAYVYVYFGNQSTMSVVMTIGSQLALGILAVAVFVAILILISRAPRGKVWAIVAVSLGGAFVASSLGNILLLMIMSWMNG